MINLASGHPTRIGHLLEGLIALSSVPIAVEVDPERVRPNDIRSLAGNADYARECLGWVPEIPLAETLRDILDEQRRVVREAFRS
jgi:GDP-4-dehydro-6-deoxy-D-mannose reductase